MEAKMQELLRKVLSMEREAAFEKVEAFNATGSHSSPAYQKAEGKEKACVKIRKAIEEALGANRRAA